MKQPIVLSIDEVVARLPDFGAVLDARSPSEHAEDHLPGAVSAPVLSDTERERVGTLHAQMGAFEAARVGAALVSRNIADFLDTHTVQLPRDWQPLVYCWRGGNRSGALSTVLARVGWRTHVLAGGYRDYRRRVLADLGTLPQGLRFVVVAGRTGSAKSRILDALAARGEQVLDLEALGAHRGSVLGALPDRPQPSQRLFESRIWHALRGFDAARPVYVESESKKVGARHVPDELMRLMRASACVRIESPLAQRARFLLDDYEHFVTDRVSLFDRLDALVELHGRQRIDDWKALASADRWEEFVAVLLEQHYDPAYDRSMHRNYVRALGSPGVPLDGFDTESLAAAAARVVEAAGTVTPHPDPQPAA